MDKDGKTCKVYIQDVKISYLVNELIKCLPDDKAFGHAAKDCAHPKHLDDLHQSLNQNVLPDVQDHNTRSPSSTTDIDQATCNTSNITSNSESSVGQQPHVFNSSLGSTHTYNLQPWNTGNSSK